MFLTASGIYGVLAFAVTRLVGAHGLRLVALGTLLGGGLTFALARVVRANGGAAASSIPDCPPSSSPWSWY